MRKQKEHVTESEGERWRETENEGRRGKDGGEGRRKRKERGGGRSARSCWRAGLRLCPSSSACTGQTTNVSTAPIKISNASINGTAVAINRGGPASPDDGSSSGVGGIHCAHPRPARPECEFRERKDKTHEREEGKE
eukprot:3047888-Rhodomonas_salina.2